LTPFTLVTNCADEFKLVKRSNDEEDVVIFVILIAWMMDRVTS